ncbi:hypothetical protein, variant [Aphanomyces invadans]|uniref:Kinesin motor domain-containing protein n=1 Tax=Aphanomyces invadans TaxID=157072 RepID=A0A024U892_9STRA|nr:hypothetical protein, variant [Aphanomyces invadans]ETW02666.1 hypothetical protein, variant [Aphanomyces invadans]|eukprot:XP_008869271.1 hypothetical protein, variant [Aphanomyces invadans]
MEESIDVCIRVRPLNEREIKAKDANVLRCVASLNAISITDRNGTPLPGQTSAFQYDHIFDEGVPTSTIYGEVAKRIVHSTLKGINGTIFAYGQTSSGKTHTMHGDVHTELGILPLAVEHIFGYIEQSTDRDFLIRVSYVEIYNEVIRDLLCDDKSLSSLKIREDPKKGIYLESQEVIITDYDDIFRVLELGEQRRTVGQTIMNERSSRSHSIFRIVIESKMKSSPSTSHESMEELQGGVLVGVLNLVDLAGSESVRHTASEGMRLREASNINRSLLTLSRVINSLAQGSESIQNAPFRDSKLTRLLQSSLAGSTRTLMICCVTPSDRHVEETKSTLQFAARAKNIQLSARVNEVLDDQAQLQRLKREVFELRQQMESNAAIIALKAENMALAEVKSKHEVKIERLMSLIVSSNETPTCTKSKAKRTRETWGPGDVLNSLQQHSANLEEVILHELQTSSSQNAKKKRKEGHLDEQTGENQVITHLKIQLDAKEQIIQQLKAQPCATCSEHADEVKQLEKLLKEVDNHRADLHAQLEEACNQLHDSQLNQETMIQKVKAFDEVLEESEASRSEAIEQMLLLESQHCQVQAHLADQIKKCQEAEDALVALQAKFDQQDKAPEIVNSAAGDESSLAVYAAESYEAKYSAQSALHAQEMDMWKAKYEDLESQLSIAHAEVVSMQTNTSILNGEIHRLNEECAVHQIALNESNAKVKFLEGAIDHAKSVEKLLQAAQEEAEKQVECIGRAKDEELVAMKDANYELSVKFEQAKVMFESQLENMTQALNDFAKENEVFKQDKAVLTAEKVQLQQTVTQQAERLDELMRYMASGAGTSVEVEELKSQLVGHRDEASRLEALVRNLVEENPQLKIEFEIAAKATVRQSSEEADQAQEKLHQLCEHYKQKESASEACIANLNNVILGLNEHVQLLSEESAKLQSEKAQLLQRVDELSNQTKSMKSEFASQTKEREDSLAERDTNYEVLKAEMDAMIKTHAKEGEVLRKQMEGLQDQVVNVNIELLQKQHIIESLLVQNDASQSNASTANETEVAALEERLAAMNNEKNALKAESDKHAQVAAELERNLVVMNGEVSTLKAALEARMMSQQETIVELQNLRSALSVSEVNVKSFQEKYNGAVASLDAMTKNCMAMETKCNTLFEGLAEKDNLLAQVREDLQVLELRSASKHADLERTLQEQKISHIEDLKRANLTNDELRAEIEAINAAWREQCAAVQASRDTDVNALASTKQALELKIQDMNAKMSAIANDELLSLNAQLVTLKNELDAQLEEKEALYDKIEELEKAAICSAQRQAEHAEMLQRQWDMEKATLTDQLDVQRDRINKLELVKMTKGHLEVFEKLKLNIKKKTEEVAALKRQVLESKNDELVELMEERWKAEQNERKLVEAKIDELKLKLNTTQNEFQIKNSEVASLQHAINQYEGHIDTLESQIRQHGNSAAEIKELSQQVTHLEDLVQRQRQQLLMHEEDMQNQAQLRDVHTARLADLQILLNDKDLRLKQYEDDALSKEKDWQATSDDLHEKFQADLRYLEKENLELHIELKQAKRLLSGKGISPPPTSARFGLQELHNSEPSSLTKSLLGPAKITSLSLSTQLEENKENTPAESTTSPPEECKQQ